ncbi:MAG TPA: FAD-dependent oxidoreductase [Vicinamibacterales bacterium]|nr:FAD-dependent oxidoreductase [Vicinamibacterales bacterium]
MDRRSFIRFSGAGAMGLALQACAPKGAKPQAAPLRPRRVLPVVNASWDRVIRTTIGLRPHRPSGFVLRADKLDAKTLIHNFGHGGSGMSLSWGTASMAADLALPHQDRRAAVLGSGVVGLTSARELQRRGFEVTIYAATVPPDTTSNMSLAGWTPTSGLVQQPNRTAQWDAQFREAALIAYRRLQLLAGPKYGISWILNYSPTDNDQAGRGGGGGGGGTPLMPESITNPRIVLQPGEHPFPTRFAIERTEMRIEPSIYLDALMDDFLLWGGKVVIRKFETPADVSKLAENVIINCTGLGSKPLFNDPELMPLKGQLTVLMPQSEVNYSTSGGARAPTTPDAGFIHMMPRTDGIVLGGTSLRDDWSLEVNEKERQRIVEAHIELFGSMGVRRT